VVRGLSHRHAMVRQRTDWTVLRWSAVVAEREGHAAGVWDAGRLGAGGHRWRGFAEEGHEGGFLVSGKRVPSVEGGGKLGDGHLGYCGSLAWGGHSVGRHSALQNCSVVNCPWCFKWHIWFDGVDRNGGWCFLCTISQFCWGSVAYNSLEVGRVERA
jgi:hypothetical protein